METERVEKNLRKMIGNLSDEADDNRSGRLNEIRKKRMRIICQCTGCLRYFPNRYIEI